MTRRVLFLCSQNRLRSPTAEQVFAGRPDIEVASGGLNHDAEHRVAPERLARADTNFVMERAHRARLAGRIRRHLGRQRGICLDIPDEHRFMDPALVLLLQARVRRHLPPA